MKTQALKPIFFYLLTCIFYLQKINAQIVYTDVNPDLVVNYNPSAYYNLDLNNDGTPDFKLHFIWGIPTQHGILFSTLDSNQANLNRHSLNSQIGSTTIWTGATGALLLKYDSHSVTYYGPWSYSGGDYLTLKLKVGNQNYYGWVRLALTASTSLTSFTVKEYAFNSTPNQPILAGETSCAAPTVTLSASGPLSFCAGDSVTLTANGTGYLYQWKKNGVNITGAKSKTYVAKTAGTYKCKVTNSCGSKTSGGKTVTVPCRLTDEVFTEQLENPYEFNIGPNPLSNSTTISFSLSQSQKVSLKIFGLNGRLVSILADKFFEEGEHQIEFNAEKINAGIYFLKMQAREFLKTEKLIVTK